MDGEHRESLCPRVWVEWTARASVWPRLQAHYFQILSSSWWLCLARYLRLQYRLTPLLLIQFVSSANKKDLYLVMAVTYKVIWSSHAHELCLWLEYLQPKSWLRGEQLKLGKKAKVLQDGTRPRSQAEENNICFLKPWTMSSISNPYNPVTWAPPSLRGVRYQKTNIMLKPVSEKKGQHVKRCYILRASGKAASITWAFSSCQGRVEGLWSRSEKGFFLSQ